MIFSIDIHGFFNGFRCCCCSCSCCSCSCCFPPLLPQCCRWPKRRSTSSASANAPPHTTAPVPSAPFVDKSESALWCTLRGSPPTRTMRNGHSEQNCARRQPNDGRVCVMFALTDPRSAGAVLRQLAVLLAILLLVRSLIGSWALRADGSNLTPPPASRRAVRPAMRSSGRGCLDVAAAAAAAAAAASPILPPLTPPLPFRSLSASSSAPSSHSSRNAAGSRTTSRAQSTARGGGTATQPS